MARVLYSYAKNDMQIVGFTVDACCIPDGTSTYCGLPLVPFDVVGQHFPGDSFDLIIAMGFIGMNELRAKKYQEAKAKGYQFQSYIHPSVMKHDGVTIGENSIILDHVSIHPGTQIGIGTFISSNVNIGHDCTIGEHSYITSGVAIAGGCTLGARSFMGVNASMAHGVVTGRRNFIAANTLINRDTQDDEVFVSAPGQLFRLKSKAFLSFSRTLD